MIILRQLEFARRDYEGLTDKQKEALREERSKLAKKLLDKRKEASDHAGFWLGKNTSIEEQQGIFNGVKKSLRNHEAELNELGKNVVDRHNSDENIKSAIYRYNISHGRLPWDNLNELYDKELMENIRDERKKVSDMKGKFGAFYTSRNSGYDNELRNINKEAEKARNNILSQSANNSSNTTNTNTNINTNINNKSGFFKKIGDLYAGKSKYGKKGQAVAIGGTIGTAALVGGGIALHRNRKKKKEKERKEREER